MVGREALPKRGLAMNLYRRCCGGGSVQHERGGAGPGGEGGDAHARITPGGPQNGAAEQRVLVLPVVPVHTRRNRIVRFGQKAFFDVGQGDHTAFAIRFDGENRVFPGLQEDLAGRAVLVEGAAERTFREQGQRQATGDEMSLGTLPLALRDRVFVPFRVAASIYTVVRAVYEGREVPEPGVADLLIAEKRVILHIAEEGMNEDKARALLDAPQDSIASGACQAGPSVEAGDNHDLERRRACQVFLHIAVDDTEVISVAAVHMVIVVPNAPAVDVPVTVNADGGGLKVEALHQLHHVPAKLDGRNEEAFDGATRQLCRPVYVGGDDRGGIGDVVLVERTAAGRRSHDATFHGSPLAERGGAHGDQDGDQCGKATEVHYVTPDKFFLAPPG